MTPPSEALAVQTGIDLTLRTVEQRVRLYRWVMIAFLILLVGSVGLSLVVRLWWPLTGLILTVPAMASYLALDGRAVRRWASQIQDLRNSHGLSLQVFSGMILAHPLIPKGTAKGMLAELTR
jgi:hypothetical protein